MDAAPAEEYVAPVEEYVPPAEGDYRPTRTRGMSSLSRLSKKPSLTRRPNRNKC